VNRSGRSFQVTSLASVDVRAPYVPPPNPADADVLHLCDAPGCTAVADTLHLDAPHDNLAKSTRVLLACSGHDPGGRHYDLAEWFEDGPHSMRHHLARKIDGERLVRLVDGRLTGGVA
jgi:hypothetical protein